ncbi:hypothetical protein DFH09DRAFT_1367515 [Mycena vulgaris]|nr:hypothetical protein DFH09DRAFT_1367515 [Mycena vulgaris]
MCWCFTWDCAHIRCWEACISSAWAGVGLKDLFADEDDTDAGADNSAVNLGHPLFESITHLDIFDPLDAGDEPRVL